jgi:GNAT superfamily N-acetyltransferase
MESTFVVRSVADDPALADQIQDQIEEFWPPYVIQAYPPKGHPFQVDWMGVYRRWPRYQIALFDQATGQLVASANALTLAWDGDAHELPDEGWEWVMHQAQLDFEARLAPKTVCALGVTIRPDVRGQNLSRRMLELLRERAQADGFARLIVSVRPNFKARYPLTPIDDYMRWTNDEGLPFDPWLRVHARLGAQIVKPCPRSTVFTGSVAEWERWAGMKFPASGDYVVPEMLDLLHIDREADQGLHIEPNIWVVHELH